jgi:hypothetical protein
MVSDHKENFDERGDHHNPLRFLSCHSERREESILIFFWEDGFFKTALRGACPEGFRRVQNDMRQWLQVHG